MRISSHYIDYPVACLNCGREYTPVDSMDSLHLFKVPLYGANNFCSIRCLHESNERLLGQKVIEAQQIKELTR